MNTVVNIVDDNKCNCVGIVVVVVLVVVVFVVVLVNSVANCTYNNVVVSVDVCVLDVFVDSVVYGMVVIALAFTVFCDCLMKFYSAQDFVSDESLEIWGLISTIGKEQLSIWDSCVSTCGVEIRPRWGLEESSEKTFERQGSSEPGKQRKILNKYENIRSSRTV